MALHGKLGNDIFDGTALANLQTVNLTRVGDAHDISSMGDLWSQQLAGLTDFTVAAEGKSQIGLDTIALLGAEGANLVIIQEDASSYSANAILSAFTETAVVDDVITLSYTIEGSDAAGLVYAASGTGGSGASNTIHGKHIDAEYAVGTPFTDIRGWTVDASVPLSDVTVATASAGGNCGRLKIAGIKTASATVTILTPTTDLDLQIAPGDTATALNLWRAEATVGTGYYSGAAVCTGSTQGISTTGEEVTTLSFIYTDTVTMTLA